MLTELTSTILGEKDKAIAETYRRRAESLIEGGYRSNWSYMGYKALTDWWLLANAFYENKHILNIGCSEPIDELYQARKAASWTAIDISEETIEVARILLERELSQETYTKIKLEVQDMRALTFPDNSFDIVCCFSTMEHLESRVDRQKTLHEMARVVIPSGYVAITVPNRLSYFWFEDRKLTRSGKSDYGYGYLYTRWELSREIRQAGLIPWQFVSDMRVLAVPNWVDRYLFGFFKNFGARMGILAYKPKK